jgi:hypothetical protein
MIGLELQPAIEAMPGGPFDAACGVARDMLRRDTGFKFAGTDSNGGDSAGRA